MCLLKASEHLLCTADVTGRVHLQDPGTLQVVHRFTAHSMGMSDMDVVGHCLVTCGLSQQYGQLCVDPELSVTDLRMLRPLPPLPATMPQPMLVKAMPALPSAILLLSQLGEFQFVDIRGLMTPATMALHRLRLPAEGAMPCASDISPSCHCLAFGDSCGGSSLLTPHPSPLTPHPSLLSVSVCHDQTFILQVRFICGCVDKTQS